MQFVDFKELVTWILQAKKNPELFAMTVWSIWNQCNQVRLQQPSWSLHLTPQVSKDRLEEFQAVQLPPKPPPIFLRVRWCPPPLGFVKINFDGAVFSKENKSGASIVIWKREGFMLAAQSWQFNQAYSPSAIEAVAAHTNL